MEPFDISGVDDLELVELVNAVKTMKNRKAICRDGINLELWYGGLFFTINCYICSTCVGRRAKCQNHGRRQN